MRVALKGRPTLDLTRALHIDLNQRRYVMTVGLHAKRRVTNDPLLS
jgi:hypothetical protein